MSSILTTSSTEICVPIYGQIAAGVPMESAAIIGWRFIRRPQGYRANQLLCAVIVNGDSLIGAHILSGDYAICKLTSKLERNGQLAAVLIPEGLTLKYVWQLSDGRIRLEGRNPAYKDCFYEAEDLSIQAVVIGIERAL